MNPNLLIGQMINDYEIIRHLGQSEEADLYLLKDTRLNRFVALKVFFKQESMPPHVEREVRTVAHLQHPNIVNIYDVGLISSGQPYVLVQYIEGGSLSDRLRLFRKEGFQPPVKDVLQLVYQIADALHVAHEAGIIHRDIKPSNILLQKNGAPVLADLGIAAMKINIKQTQALLGTPNYVSPEQAMGNRLDGRSDIYSLGIVLYELLSGHVPFNAESSMGILHKHIYEPLPPLRSIRPDLEEGICEVVDKCLQKLPEQRFQTAAELKTAIEGLTNTKKIVIWSQFRNSSTNKKQNDLFIDRFLPIDYSNQTALKIYAKRVATILAIALANISIWMIISSLF